MFPHHLYLVVPIFMVLLVIGLLISRKNRREGHPEKDKPLQIIGMIVIVIMSAILGFAFSHYHMR